MVSMSLKKEIANAMGKETSLVISPTAVIDLPDTSSGMQIFAAQIGSMTMLCWKESNGNYEIKKINW